MYQRSSLSLWRRTTTLTTTNEPYRILLSGSFSTDPDGNQISKVNIFDRQLKRKQVHKQL